MSGKQLGRHSIYTFLCFFAAISLGHAATLFEDDFEADVTGNANPVWNWQPAYVGGTNQFGMMYGTGDMYTRSLAVKNSGNYSLRLNFEGRNDFCNFCNAGSQNFVMQSGSNNQVMFLDDGGANLGPYFTSIPDAEVRVYNKTDNWARWKAVSVSGNRIDFEGNAPVQNDMGGDGDFDAGDEITIEKTCALNTQKKKDCNLAINYLQGVDPANDFPYGGTLARRIYMYVPSATTMPDAGFKIAYSHFRRSGSVYSQVLVLRVPRGNKIEIDNKGLYGKYEGTALTLDTDTWYYLEEEYVRESSNGGTDGIYRLWGSRGDQATSVPLVEQTGITYGELVDMSIIGNFQHNNKARGSLYIDDVKIATNRIGPVSPLPIYPLAPVNADIP